MGVVFTGQLAKFNGFKVAQPVETDPHGDKVSLLMRMDDAGFSDATGKTVQIIGTPSRVAHDGFGTAFYKGTSTSNYLAVEPHSDFAFPADWTIECWARFDQISTGVYHVALWLQSTNGQYFAIRRNRLDGRVSIDYGIGTRRGINGPAVAANTWYHLAASLQGDTLRFFVDGVLQGTATVTAKPTQNMRVAVGYNLTSGTSFEGHSVAVDDVRITKGVARYTEGFTPPTAPLIYP